jgi:hypothetical protein
MLWFGGKPWGWVASQGEIIFQGSLEKHKVSLVNCTQQAGCKFSFHHDMKIKANRFYETLTLTAVIVGFWGTICLPMSE